MPKHGTIENPHNEPDKPGYNPENTFGYARGGEVKPGMLDFGWKKYIEGSQEYRESQQDLYMQDKEYWDDYKAHRGYLDTVKNDAEARHSIKEMDSFGYGTTRG